MQSNPSDVNVPKPCNYYSHLKDGFYIISSLGDIDHNGSCLVYLYDHPDFNGVRHISYNAVDGAAIVPITDLNNNTVLTPVNFIISDIAFRNNPEDFKNIFDKDIQTNTPTDVPKGQSDI